jgi:hypothetical protein
MSCSGNQRKGSDEVNEQERFVHDEEQELVVKVRGIRGKEREP